VIESFRIGPAFVLTDLLLGRVLGVWQCHVMPSVSPSIGVTSSHRHHRRLATELSNISSMMTSTSLTGREQLLSRTNLYIRGLKPETTDKDLVTLCQQLVYSLFAYLR